MPQQHIGAKISDDKRTAYVSLPGYELKSGIATKTILLDELIPNFKGPRIHLDFDHSGTCIGIEILASTDKHSHR